MPTTVGLRRVTGGLFVGSALAFATAATLPSSTFDWPDILREPAGVVLPAFAAGGTNLVWAWLATARVVTGHLGDHPRAPPTERHEAGYAPWGVTGLVRRVRGPTHPFTTWSALQTTLQLA
jgi:hypothetical protein